MEKSQGLEKSPQLLAFLRVFPNFIWLKIFPIYFCVTQLANTKLRIIMKRKTYMNKSIRLAKRDKIHVVTYKKCLKVYLQSRFAIRKREKSSSQKEPGSQKE